MSKFATFLNQSSFNVAGRAGAYAPELRGTFAERFGMPLMLAAFALSGIVALAQNI